jgi:hypothetical protein
MPVPNSLLYGKVHIVRDPNVSTNTTRHGTAHTVVPMPLPSNPVSLALGPILLYFFSRDGWMGPNQSIQRLQNEAFTDT